MKKKILFVFIFFVLFLLFFLNSESLASFDFRGQDGNDYSLPDLPSDLVGKNYFIVKAFDTGYISIYYTSSVHTYRSECSVYYNEYGVDCIHVTGSYYYRLTSDGSEWQRRSLSGGVHVSGIKKQSIYGGFWYSFLYCNYDILDTEGNVSFSSGGGITYPYIENKEQISTGKFDKLVVNSGDLHTYDNQEFYLMSYYYSENSIDSIFPRKEILLNGPMSFYFVGSNSNSQYIYEVPISQLGIDLVEGNKYGFRLAILNPEGNYDFIDNISFTIGTVTVEEKEQADRDKQLALQEEQNETSKGIWETLISVLNFINPLSEDFFVYKLIDLLLEALKSFFLPDEEFFVEFSTEVNEFLSERLGVLYFPIDIVVTFFERVNEISESGSATISWGDFNFMGATLINAGSYDLNSLLTNNTIRNVHSVYLVFVDVILWLGLVFLAKNLFTDIFGGKYDELDNVASDGYQAYKNYKLEANSRKKSSRIGYRM